MPGAALTGQHSSRPLRPGRVAPVDERPGDLRQILPLWADGCGRVLTKCRKNDATALLNGVHALIHLLAHDFHQFVHGQAVWHLLNI